MRTSAALLACRRFFLRFCSQSFTAALGVLELESDDSTHSKLEPHQQGDRGSTCPHPHTPAGTHTHLLRFCPLMTQTWRGVTPRQGGMAPIKQSEPGTHGVRAHLTNLPARSSGAPVAPGARRAHGDTRSSSDGSVSAFQRVRALLSLALLRGALLSSVV